MSNSTEDRLRRALAARAQQVTPESLRPTPAPAARRTGTLRWAAPLLATAAAVTAVVAGLVYAGLTGEEARTGPATKPADEVVTGTSCRRESGLVARALDRRWVDADVDGDGRLDRVAVARAARARAECRVFVGVRTATGTTYSNALGASAVASGKVPFPPTILALPELGDAGAEIVVDGRARADGALVQVFTLAEGRLSRVEVPGADDDAFYVEGGGITAPSGAGCRADGTLVLSTAEAQGREYRVTRQFYRLVGDTLATASPQATETVPGDALVQRFPEFGRSHFVACGGQVRSSGS